MGDPHSYITPDVVADFSTVQLKDLGHNRVQVSGVKGYEPTPFYKISMAYRDGYKCSGNILISGPQARKKAESFHTTFWNRCHNAEFLETGTEFIGWNACHRSLGHKEDGNEVLLRLSVRSRSDSELKTFRKLISSLILSGPPGVTVLSEGVGKLQSVVSYWPSLISKNLVHARIACGEEVEQVNGTLFGNYAPKTTADDLAHRPSRGLADLFSDKASNKDGEWLSYYDLCLARSGDKGDTANIGVIARSEGAYEFLKADLTAQKVKDLFQEFCSGKVTRFRLDGLLGLNFLLEKSLGGGGSRSLRADAQGKTFSQALLRQKVFVPSHVINSGLSLSKE